MELVTCIVSSYNRPTLIKDAIDSLLAQTWPNIQIIIADDHSNPPILEAIRRYYQPHPIWQYPTVDFMGLTSQALSLQIVRPGFDLPSDAERQYGQRCAIGINAATKYALGDFICYLPDDDMLTPRSIEVRVRYLLDHPKVNVVYGRLESCKSPTPVPGFHWLGPSPLDCGPHTLALTYCIHDRLGFWESAPQAAIENKVDHSMPLFRRVPDVPSWPVQPWSVLRDAQLDAESWGLAFHDCPDSNFFLACRMAGLGPFHSVPDIVTVKRYHSQGHRTDPGQRE